MRVSQAYTAGRKDLKTLSFSHAGSVMVLIIDKAPKPRVWMEMNQILFLHKTFIYVLEQEKKFQPDLDHTHVEQEHCSSEMYVAAQNIWDSEFEHRD